MTPSDHSELAIQLDAFKDLHIRLTETHGLHRFHAGELASALFPSLVFSPVWKPLVGTQEIDEVLNQFMNEHSLSLEEVWQRIWGITPQDYFAEYDRCYFTAGWPESG